MSLMLIDSEGHQQGVLGRIVALTAVADLISFTIESARCISQELPFLYILCLLTFCNYFSWGLCIFVILVIFTSDGSFPGQTTLL